MSTFYYSIISSGTIEINEMIDILVTFYDMEGVPREKSIPYADKIFKTLDDNCDGTLDEEEFCKGCLMDPDFSCIIHCSIERLNHVQELSAKAL